MVDSIKNSFSRVDPQQKGRASDVSNGPAKSAAGKASVAASSAETATSVCSDQSWLRWQRRHPLIKKQYRKLKKPSRVVITQSIWRGSPTHLWMPTGS